MKRRKEAGFLPLEVRSPSGLQPFPLRVTTKPFPRGNSAGVVLGPALLAECIKPTRAEESLECSEGRKHAPPRAEEHSAPDGATAPRARACPSREMGRAATGSARSASLRSRISSLLACSRARAELQPEPDCERGALWRKSKEEPWRF